MKQGPTKVYSDEEQDDLSTELTRQIEPIVKAFYEKYLKGCEYGDAVSVLSTGVTEALTNFQLEPVKFSSAEVDLPHILMATHHALDISFSKSQQRMIENIGRYTH